MLCCSRTSRPPSILQQPLPESWGFPDRGGCPALHYLVGDVQRRAEILHLVATPGAVTPLVGFQRLSKQLIRLSKKRNRIAHATYN